MEPLNPDRGAAAPGSESRPWRFELVQHVQLAIPAGAEGICQPFYGTLLGMEEVVKPAALASRGGLWFRMGGVEVHLGVDPDFQPAKKAHPGIEVIGLSSLGERLTRNGYDIRWDEALPSVDRFYVHDPVGNRIEFLEPESARRNRTSPGEVLRRMLAAFSTGDVRDCDQYVSDSYVDHQGRAGRPLRGPDGFREVVRAAHAVAPPQLSIEDMITSGTHAVARVRWKFASRGPGDAVERETIEIVLGESGKAVEHWGGEAWVRTASGPAE